MEYIGIEKRPSNIEIVRFVHSIFSGRPLINMSEDYSKLFVFNDFSNIENEDGYEEPNSLMIHIEPNESEFKTAITLLGAPEKDEEEREFFLAHKLSNHFKCRAIINGPDSIADHPYCCLIIDKDVIYEADDDGTVWGDGEGDEVRIVRRLELPVYEFDEMGNKKMSCGNKS